MCLRTQRSTLLPFQYRVLIIFLFLSSDGQSATHKVNSARQFQTLVQSKKVSPGDTIVWRNGVYDNVELNVDGVDGTKGMPIQLRAATPGGVVFRGKSRLNIGTQWWVIHGFHFSGKTGGRNSYNTVQFRSRSGKGAQHVRMTQCALTNLTTDSSTSKWVLIYGRFNRIDHCHFTGKNSRGALITVELGYLEPKETAEHRIEWNYFGNFAAGKGNDNETIRVGYSGDQNKPARCRIEHNYFVRCNGENEIISNKSSFNTYFANTFRQCNGALVLRHGHHVRVAGNFFFGDGADNSGGIRVVDSKHHIFNNYLQDLTGTKWNAAFSILGGKQSSGGSGNGYQAVDDIVVAHNSIINCRRSIFFNQEKGKRAPTGVIANNLVSSRTGPLILEQLSADKMKWTGNILHGPRQGKNTRGVALDPQLSRVDGLYRPSSTGPAANAAVQNVINVGIDIDGQSRPKTRLDIGADEVSGAQGGISLKPLTPSDVGVSYLRGSGPKLH